MIFSWLRKLRRSSADPNPHLRDGAPDARWLSVAMDEGFRQSEERMRMMENWKTAKRRVEILEDLVKFHEREVAARERLRELGVMNIPRT